MNCECGGLAHNVDGEEDSDNEADDDISPVIVVETVARQTAQQRHHHEAECDKRTQDTHLAAGARHVVNVYLGKANSHTISRRNSASYSSGRQRITTKTRPK